MINPATASELANDGINVCTSAAKLLRETIENHKRVKADLVDLVKEVEQYRNVLRLLKFMTGELLRTSFRDLGLDIDTTKIKTTLKTLRELASSIAETDQNHGQVWAGIQWTFKKTVAENLTYRLREEERQLMSVVIRINARAALRSLQDFQDLKAAMIEKKFVVEPFDGSTRLKSGNGLSRRNWLGCVNTEAHSAAYNDARKQLADAAYKGDWKTVFKSLEHGRQHHQENWVNAFRIKSSTLHDSLSFWTILHQAALWKAPTKVVQELLDRGAFRTLRTHYSSGSYRDQTPSEVANDQGYSDLARMLAPVIRSQVPDTVLGLLESNFHDLIRRDLGGRVDRDHLYLPALEVLKELDAEAIWFAIKGHKFENAGYWFRLDGRDLLVRSHCIAVASAAKDYRITPRQVKEVEVATLINENK